jgi:hypothetical protein
MRSFPCPLALPFFALLACNGGGAADPSDASSSTGGDTTGCMRDAAGGCVPGTTSDAPTTDPTTGSPTTTTAESTGSTDTTGPISDTNTTTTTDAETTGSSDTGADDTSTGDTEGVNPVCLEKVAQNFVPTGKVLDMSELGGFVQASWYDPVADRMCFVVSNGDGQCYTPEGAKLGPKIKAPGGVIDGAVYDAARNVVLLLTQSCLLIEADPTTLKLIGQVQLDAQALDLITCAGLGLTPDNDLYVASYQNGEIVTISRDGQTELARFSSAAAGVPGPDGLNVISGVGDLLLQSSAAQHKAGIVSNTGAVIVAASPAGQAAPPINGGTLNAPDDTLTLCESGHVWVCDQAPSCTEYMPEDGDRNICPCFAGCEMQMEKEGVCDGVDDDCNGAIDDLDAGGDGICDCTTMAVLGSKGANPNTKFEAFLDAQSPGWKRYPDINPLTAESLAGIDVLILDNLARGYTVAEADVLRDWVKGGGGLAVLAGYAVNGDKQSSILASLGVKFNGPPTNATVTAFAAHPLSKQVTSLPLVGGNNISDLQGDGTVVATFNTKIFALAAQRELGRIYLYGDEWVTFDEVWDDQAEQFWLNALAWLSTGGGNCGLAPVYPETCAELRAEYPGVGDGDNTLHVDHDPQRPWTAYCRNMATTPIEYLPLVAVAEGKNFAQYTAGGASPGTDVRSKFSRVRLDPKTLLVDIDDTTYATSSGQLLHADKPVTRMPYGIAMNCEQGQTKGLANVDLTGTPFKVTDPFCNAGNESSGVATISPDGKTVDVTGGGYCGWTSPTLADDGCPITPELINNGPALNLEYVGQ